MFVEDFSTPETEVVEAVYSREGLASWLRSQDPATKYNWEGDDCMLCRYLNSRGVDHGNPYLNSGTNYGKLESVIGLGVAGYRPWTYGAASSRLAALQGKG